MSDRRLRIAHACAAIGLLLTLPLAGCTSRASGTAPDSQPPPSGLPVAHEIPDLLDTTTLQLPLDSYLPTIQQANQRAAAQRLLIRRCMLRFGVRVTLPEPPTNVGLKTQNERRYGLTDAAAATTIGYGLGDRDPRLHPDGRDKATKLAGRSLAVLTGEGSDLPRGLPAGGCSGEVNRQLAPVDPGTHQPLDENLPQRLSLESFQRSQEDPRVKAAFSEWSSCMSAKNHQYRTPLEPPADPAFAKAGSAKERQTAQDDVACKASTNLVGIWFPVESAYQTMLIGEHRDELAALQQGNAVVRKLVLSLPLPKQSG